MTAVFGVVALGGLYCFAVDLPLPVQRAVSFCPAFK